MIDEFLEAHRLLGSFSLRTGLGIKDGEDRRMLQRGLNLLEKADLDTVDGRQAAVEYLTIQLESARSLTEVVRRLSQKFFPLSIDVFEEIEEDTPRHIAAYEGAINFLSV